SRLRALITGAAGFAGTHLAENLLGEDALEVWGTVHRSALPALPSLAGLQSVACDTSDPEQVRAVLAEVRPNWIFHLAGQSDVGGSWQSAWATLELNVRGQLNIFQAMLQLDLDARVLVMGST